MTLAAATAFTAAWPGPTALGAPALRAWRFDELVREGLALIPAHAPEWTNHNASDPGITLVDLLAYFTEVMVYRLGRVTPQATLAFLRLLQGDDKGDAWPDWNKPWPHWKDLTRASAQQIAEAIEQTVDALGQHEVAVTSDDFEQLAAAEARDVLGDRAVRALCVAGVIVQTGPKPRSDTNTRAHVTVVLLPEEDLPDDKLAALCAAVHERLLPRCLLTTRLHIVGPVTLHAGIGFGLALRPGARWEVVLEAIAARLRQRFGSWPGTKGPLRTAPRGTPLHVLDIVQLVDTTDGVEFVEDLTIAAMSGRPEELEDARSSVGIQIGIRSTVGVDSQLGIIPSLDPHRLVRDDAGRLGSIALQPWEILRLHLLPNAVRPLDAAEGDDGR